MPIELLGNKVTNFIPGLEYRSHSLLYPVLHPAVTLCHQWQHWWSLSQQAVGMPPGQELSAQKSDWPALLSLPDDPSVVDHPTAHWKLSQPENVRFTSKIHWHATWRLPINFSHYLYSIQLLQYLYMQPCMYAPRPFPSLSGTVHVHWKVELSGSWNQANEINVAVTHRLATWCMHGHNLHSPWWTWTRMNHTAWHWEEASLSRNTAW